MGVILSTVDENLSTKRTLDVRFLRIDFCVLLCRGLVLQAGLEVYLEPGSGDEKFWAVVARNPVGFDQFFSVALVDVELEVVVVQECHRAVGTNDFFL
jgi:hypothetical protein